MFGHIKVYVGCSLTHAPEEFRRDVEIFKKQLKRICTVLCFADVGSSVARDIYEFDIHKCVHCSDIMIGICDHPSLGLGFEMGTQVRERKKPLLVLAHHSAKVSDFILDTGEPGFLFQRYNSLTDDAFVKAREVIARLDNAMKEGTLFAELAISAV